MSRPTLLLLHGWAFGPGFWRPLTALLPGYPVRALDMGFFGPEDMDFTRPGDAPVVAVGHSLGLLELLAMRPAPFDALVSLGGFARFAVAPGPVRAMRRGLSRDAAAVLAGFHKACALPGHLAPDPAAARPDRLAWGLDELLSRDVTPALAALDMPLLAVAASDDAVVPPELTRLDFGERAVMLDHGGHAFPATRAVECARLVQGFLENI